ncbi:MAG: tRNA-dihydrouridine synthase [Candidatus Moraniibacteriota bacterium]|nr:MAG: tRNA-dihydrouridine synthase [Candidatus Moranbacteria bacterium]
MRKNFWQELPKPFFALAPMAGVTDTVFRQIIARRAKPDVFWTEFVSCDGICSRGREALLRDFIFTEIERPIVAQVFGATPKHFYETARLVVSLGFDGIDINMGCPDKAVVAQGAGAALIRTPELARDIISATREGIMSAGSSMSLSVKTRTGFDRDEVDTWIPTLLDMQLDALTIHARTKKELSDVPARWDDVARVVSLARGTDTLVIGNGDVRDLADAKQKANETGADGVMMGRAIFGNPWAFEKNGKIPTVQEKIRALVEHTRLYEETWGSTKSFDLMKKHYKAYANGFSNASDLRVQLMLCRDADEVASVVESFLHATTI